MKQITITFLLTLAAFAAFSQTKFSAGVYTEGGYFFPKSESKSDGNAALGAGIFADYKLTPKLGVSLQAGYRFKSNDATNIIFYGDGNSPYGYGGYGSGYETISKTFKQHYIVLPFKVSYLLTKKLFIEAGIETACILNYDKIPSQLPDGTYVLPETYNLINKKYEFDWIVGLGYNFSPKLKASVNYTQGFKDQGTGIKKSNSDGYGQIYKNRMLMVNLSYSIFSSKK